MLRCLPTVVALVICGVAQARAQQDHFQTVDAWALAAAPSDEESVATLSKYLMKGCKTDKDKARIIYRWIADWIAYDVEWLRTGKDLVQQPEPVLRKRKTDCVGYSTLFVELAARMDIKAVRVDGFVKLPDHKAGQKIGRSHSWNAVQIDNQWYLVDPTAGAGGVAGETFVKRFGGFFFLIDPEMWIFLHFPKEERWQLLKYQVTMQSFEQWPFVDPYLFRIGVSPSSVRELLKENKEMVKAIPCPGESTRLIEVPLALVLDAGKPYRFVMRSRDFDQIVLLGGDNQVTVLDKKGEEFSGQVKATKGVLRMGGVEKGSKSAYALLEYMVK